MTATSNTLIILHPVHEPVGRAELRDALTPDEREIPHVAEIPAIHIPYGEPAIDWPAAVDAQNQQLAENYFPKLKTLDTPRIIYAGRAPIPLVIHLGCQLGPFREIQARQPRHTNKRWQWDDSPHPQLQVHRGGFPTEHRPAHGDVVIRIATSYAVDPAYTRMTVDPSRTLAEIDIRTTPLDPDVLHHPDAIQAVASAFRDALTAVRDHLPGTRRIHLFASVPLGLAFQLGNRIQKNIDRPVITYQFNPNGPPHYHPAINIQEDAGQPADLTSEQRAAAAQVRALWQDECARVAAFATSHEATSTGWLEIFSESDRAEIVRGLPPGWEVLPSSALPALVRARLTAEAPAGGEPYAYTPRDGEWSVADEFLAALALRLSTEADRRLAACLFLFHEGLHRAVHGLTERTARDIGRYPKAIEVADYQADLWALVQAADLFDSRDVGFLEQAIRVALETMWCFTGVSTHLPRLEVRAVNRFLNWYWQLARIRGETRFVSALAAIASPPIIEFSGLTPTLVRGRPAMWLVPDVSRSPELVLFDRRRIHRVGVTEAGPLGDLVLGFAERNGNRIASVLAGVADSIAR